MTANLPVPRDPNLPRIADIIPLPVQRPVGRFRRALHALLQDPQPTPVTEAIDDMIWHLQALREYTLAHEANKAQQQQRRWRG